MSALRHDKRAGLCERGCISFCWSERSISRWLSYMRARAASRGPFFATLGASGAQGLGSFVEVPCADASEQGDAWPRPDKLLRRRKGARRLRLGSSCLKDEVQAHRVELPTDLATRRRDSLSACYLWSGRRDSNPRPQPWQGCALPLSYTRIRLTAPPSRPAYAVGGRRLQPPRAHPRAALFSPRTAQGQTTS
jgi:hypothetical protein